MFGLVDALTIGTRALTISANQQLPESERESSGGAIGGASLAFALVLFIGIFIVLPNAGLAFLTRWLGTGWLYHLVEGLVRMGLFLAYLAAISLISDIRRVFAYHGAEHKTIAAWELGEVLDPEHVRPYSTLHVRCCTNFLLLVMLIAIVTYSLAGAIVPAPEGGVFVTASYHVGLRIALLPIVAGLAYEGLRLGAGRDNVVVRPLMKPGLWLQKITTRPPTDDMIEVAIRSFEAVVPTASLDRRTSAALPSPVEWGPGGEVTADLGEPLGVPTDVAGAPIAPPEEEPRAGFSPGGRAASP